MDTSKIINVVGVSFLSASAVGVYLAFFWKPNVTVISVDYKLGTADIQINGRPKMTIYAGSTYDCGLGWGVKFSPHVNKNSPYFIPRIELVKNHLVHSYLSVDTDKGAVKSNLNAEQIAKSQR